MFGDFHSLKGAAAAVGLSQVAEWLHDGESLLEAVIEGRAAGAHVADVEGDAIL